MCVCKCVSDETHDSVCLSAYVRAPNCVCIYCMCVCVCVSVLSSLDVAAAAECTEYKDPLQTSIRQSNTLRGSMCVLVYLCFCQSALLTAHPSVRPSIRRPRINTGTVITRADKVSWWSSLYSMGCKQRASILPFTHETLNIGWFSYSSEIMLF